MKRRCSGRGLHAPRLRGPGDVAALLRAVAPEQDPGAECVIGLGADRSVCGAAVRCGCCDHPETDSAQLIDIADDLEALDLVLVTFVAEDALGPSAADVARYEGLRVGCSVAGIELLDHLLMSGHRWRSVRELSADPGASTSW